MAEWTFIKFFSISCGPKGSPPSYRGKVKAEYNTHAGRVDIRPNDGQPLRPERNCPRSGQDALDNASFYPSFERFPTFQGVLERTRPQTSAMCLRNRRGSLSCCHVALITLRYVFACRAHKVSNDHKFYLTSQTPSLSPRLQWSLGRVESFLKPSLFCLHHPERASTQRLRAWDAGAKIHWNKIKVFCEHLSLWCCGRRTHTRRGGGDWGIILGLTETPLSDMGLGKTNYCCYRPTPLGTTENPSDFPQTHATREHRN